MFWCVVLFFLALAHAQTSPDDEDSNVDFQDDGLSLSIGRIFLGVCDLVSVVMLLFTLILYTIGPDIRRIHGKCIAAFCLTLSLYFVCSATEIFLYDLSVKYCFQFTYAATFFCVASFCWINVATFDVWISSKRSMAGRQNRCNFLWYFLFAILAPGLVLALALVLELGSVEADEPTKNVCIHDTRGLLGFLLLWLVSVICSSVLLCLAARYVKQELNSSVYQERGHEPTSDRSRYVCYVNLFTVMAGNWIIYVLLKFVSLSLRKWLPEHSSWSSVIDYYASVLISLQGVAVFVACVWKTQYRAKLQCCGRSSYNVPQVDANNGSL